MRRFQSAAASGGSYLYPTTPFWRIALTIRTFFVRKSCKRRQSRYKWKNQGRHEVHGALFVFVICRGGASRSSGRNTALFRPSCCPNPARTFSAYPQRRRPARGLPPPSGTRMPRRAPVLRPACSGRAHERRALRVFAARWLF